MDVFFKIVINLRTNRQGAFLLKSMTYDNLMALTAPLPVTDCLFVITKHFEKDFICANVDNFLEIIGKSGKKPTQKHLRI